jgi:hypothetical protein
MSTKEVLEDLIKQMEHLRGNNVVPYLNPYKGIDDCISLMYKKLKEIEQ